MKAKMTARRSQRSDSLGLLSLLVSILMYFLSVILCCAGPTALNTALMQTFTDFLQRKLYDGSGKDTFTGRKWLFNRLIAELNKPKGTVILITGDPGTGKSAVIARLVESAFPFGHKLSVANRAKDEQPIVSVIAYHVCSFRPEDAHTRSVWQFLQNINAMLCITVPGYEAQMRHVGVDIELSKADQKEADARAAWASVLRALGTCVKPGDSSRYCIVVDSLDESLLTRVSTDLVQSVCFCLAV